MLVVVVLVEVVVVGAVVVVRGTVVVVDEVVVVVPGTVVVVDVLGGTVYIGDVGTGAGGAAGTTSVLEVSAWT